MDTQDFGSFKMGFLPREQGSVGGAICWGEWYKPSADVTLVYLYADPDLSVVLSRIDQAGGKVIMPKKQISPQYGYMALFIDSEGNRVALHSQA